MKTSMPSEKILRERMKYFVLQDFRGYIVYYREASTRQTTCLKKYHLCGDWMDRPERIKTREQTYMELMVEMMEEFIKELT
jgi:hypothetical protein